MGGAEFGGLFRKSEFKKAASAMRDGSKKGALRDSMLLQRHSREAKSQKPSRPTVNMKPNGKSRLAPPSMKLLSVLALVLLPAAIIPAQFPSGAPAYDSDRRNLLTNADFEKGAAAWELLNWGQNGRMEMDPDELHNGKPTLRVDNFQPCHSFVRQIVTGKPTPATCSPATSRPGTSKRRPMARDRALS